MPAQLCTVTEHITLADYFRTSSYMKLIQFFFFNQLHLELLSLVFHNEWRYCDKGMEGYDELEKAYNTADFIVGRDGDIKDELDFLVVWARKFI